MKKYQADLHIHTVLSPCADLEMSPDQIVQVALKRGLDIIAITDHNSTRQCDMVRKHAKGTSLLVINGCEVNSMEEVHALCLFEDDYSRDEFQYFVDQYLPDIPNHTSYHGHQLLVDEENQILEELPFYLGNALFIDLETIERKTHELNGIFLPAHVDRPINSLYSQLGFLPKELNVDGLQISKRSNESMIRTHYDIDGEISLIKASDAHYIEDIGSVATSFYMYEPSFKELRWALHKKNGRYTKIEA